MILKFCLILTILSFCEIDAIENGNLIFNLQNQHKLFSNDIAWDTILTFWEQQEQKFSLSKKRDFVLLLGNTGAGKSTIASILTDDELMAYETAPGTKEYYFRDKNDRISSNSTITSKTIIPELIMDNKTDTPYYDCPGFMDTRGLTHDITVAYFNRKLLEFARSIKLLFVVNSNSVRGIGDRNDFITLAKHITALIKNIENYRNGIALIVNKVPNELDEDFKLIEDQTYIERTAHFLNSAKTELIQRNTYENVIKLIDILLEQKNNNYTKIAVMRVANKAGPVKNMPKIQAEKQDLNTLIHQRLQYVLKKEGDFGYTISESSQNHVQELFIQLATNVDKDIKTVCSKTIEFFKQQEKQSVDIYFMNNLITSAHQNMSQLQFSSPQKFLTQMVNTAKSLGVDASTDKLKSFSDDGVSDKLFDILITISGKDLMGAFHVSTTLNKCLEPLKESSSWYSLLITLYEILSGLSIQKDVSELIKQCQIGENDERNYSDLKLNELLQQLEISPNDDVKRMRLNSYKLKALETVLLSINNKIEISCVSNNLTAMGINVRLSEILKSNICPNAKIIEIFALNKLFIDTNVNKIGQMIELIMIAPTWNVIGEKEINLDGENAAPVNPAKATSGTSVPWHPNGEDGVAGNPGLPAGRFFAIGDVFLNEESLKISANGGDGSMGQNGGDGADGFDGETAVKKQPPPFKKWDDMYRDEGFKVDRYDEGHGLGHYTKITIYGKNATKSGNGGVGGAAGSGGYAGDIQIIGLSKAPNMKTSNVTGRDSKAGEGGKGGRETKNGQTLILEFEGPLPGIDDNEKETLLFPAKIVQRGTSGGYSSRRLTPKKIAFHSPSVSINNFKNFVQNHLKGNVRESRLTEFLKKLEQLNNYSTNVL